MSTIAGDCLLSAAFITYAGYFEQQMRQNLFTTWSHHLQQANIQVLKALIHMAYVTFDHHIYKSRPHSHYVVWLGGWLGGWMGG